MPVLDRDALEDSPLADLHLIASELGVDGFRRLRKAELIDAILSRQEESGGATAEPATEPSAEEEEPGDEGEKRRGRRRGGRRRRRDADEEAEADAEAPEPETDADEPPADERAPAPEREREPETDRVVEGELEVVGNGSGFVRTSPPDPSDDDVYVSAAQIRRCELVSGDRVSGAVRPPRRSERYASLVRVETINGRPADEVEATPFEELPVAFPERRLDLGDDDVLRQIADAAPLGLGSRAVVAGPSRSGKSDVIRRLAAALSGREDLKLTVVLAGVRPEEIAEWAEGPVEPAAAVSFAGSPDAQARAVERALDSAKRLAARGDDAVVLIDGLDGLAPGTARKALAAARNIRDGGSLTVVATAARPLGGETTVVALARPAEGNLAVDRAESGTLRADRLAS